MWPDSIPYPVNVQLQTLNDINARLSAQLQQIQAMPVGRIYAPNGNNIANVLGESCEAIMDNVHLMKDKCLTLK